MFTVAIEYDIQDILLTEILIQDYVHFVDL